MYSCPFCEKPLHLHGSIGDSGIPDTNYCELKELRKLRNGLRDYAIDTSLDFDSGKRVARLGDLIVLARKLEDGQRQSPTGQPGEGER